MRFWAPELHPAHQLSRPGTDPTLSLTKSPENLELVCVPAWVCVCMFNGEVKARAQRKVRGLG